MSATLLAVDTSSAYCSVALSHQGVSSSEHLMTEQSHSENVLPMVRRLLEARGMTVQDVDAFVVGIGPGGFTGVRLGVAVVQGLAYATGKPVIALPSLLALAQAAFESQPVEMTVLVANDARMNQVYWAAYHFDVAGAYSTIQAPSLGVLDDVIAFTELQEVAVRQTMQLAGNAWTIFEAFKAWSLAHEADGVRMAAMNHDAPNALYLLPAAQRSFAASGGVPPHDVSPLYVRDKIAQTIAEREAAKAI
ncbi:tRNA threonylcarbamoyladenosine biosynthesis protein TsaB [Ephemeroptericola cinctiostellae]|uniref:tRNA threonylcarbamoyladenosine biosynthesis protein TsaB n=1 Tax=Ephemeroptericola cinctiostellae TaxID=2268024 RepID=A0A345DCM4_9BURK|nr:tRNA (adenosine(37)-N6)-threonylcarbamoyltransferase complex dimerization subunit type 1 TsaB [Ephemeroptericola cinctiostellae]AXF86112.1 tRNA threonylcarbamoyladenosine biosynthesis protein TsaB [Ephemeroptericola cinctiostellae]